MRNTENAEIKRASAQETQIMLSKAKSGYMTVKDAAKFLKENAKYRTLRDKIMRVAGRDNLQQRIVDGIAGNHPNMKRDSIQRKVRGWLNNERFDLFIDTESAIELCFIFRLDLETADAFLASVTEEGFHWRDPEQIPMIYCLSAGKYNYPKAVRLRTDILKDIPPVEKSENELYTGQVREIMAKIETEDDLRDFITGMAGRLGKRHRTAQRQFMTFMNLLENPDHIPHMPKEKEFTVREVLKTYLHQMMIPNPKEKKQLLLNIAPAQQEILQSIISGWPNETILSKMKRGEIEVGRKTLILLFMATDGGMNSEDDIEDDYIPTRDEIFEDSRRRMDTMLVNCGYRRLDARNPFDWMILYVLSVDDILEKDAQMDEILSALLNNSGQAETE